MGRNAKFLSQSITVNVSKMVDITKVVDQLHNASQRYGAADIRIFVNGEGFEAPADGSAGTPRKKVETPDERKARRRAERKAAEARRAAGEDVTGEAPASSDETTSEEEALL
jgi:hypothetical protein